MQLQRPAVVALNALSHSPQWLACSYAERIFHDMQALVASVKIGFFTALLKTKSKQQHHDQLHDQIQIKIHT